MPLARTNNIVIFFSDHDRANQFFLDFHNDKSLPKPQGEVRFGSTKASANYPYFYCDSVQLDKPKAGQITIGFNRSPEPLLNAFGFGYNHDNTLTILSGAEAKRKPLHATEECFFKSLTTLMTRHGGAFVQA